MNTPGRNPMSADEQAQQLAQMAEGARQLPMLARIKVAEELAERQLELNLRLVRELDTIRRRLDSLDMLNGARG